MSRHGGARKGAGRKPTLDLMSKLHVGAKAENFAQLISGRAAMIRHDTEMRRLGIRQAQERASEGLRSKGNAWWESSDEGEDLRSDIEFGLATKAGDDLLENPPRLISVVASRYRIRPRVLAVISRWASWYYQREVTPRQVRDCWRDYLQFQRET